MSLELALLIALLALSACFSAAETALTSLSPAKVRSLKKDRHFASAIIVRLKSNPQRLIIVILIGNTLANISASVVATEWGIRVFGSQTLGIITGVLTLTVLLFSEITPKVLSTRFALPVSRALAYPMMGLIVLLFPLIWIFEKIINGLMLLFNTKSPIHSMSEDELRAMVEIGTEEGVLEEHEQELIENVLEFTDTTVGEIMTVEKHFEALEADTPVSVAGHSFVKFSHSRIPVYLKTLDNIIGILTVRDVLKLMHDKKSVSVIGEIKFGPVIFVPTTRPINKLFHEFQKRRQHIAIVVDERGQTLGLVTMEDILEEIVGEIADEYDKESKHIQVIGKNTWQVSGEATIEEMNGTLGIKLDYPGHQTVSLLILEQLRRFPKQGEKIAYENLIMQVTRMTPKRIDEVEVTKIPLSEENPSY